jgi:transposase
MPQSNDLSRSVAGLNQDSMLVVVIEMGQSSWLVTVMIPGVSRQPLKELAPDEGELLRLLHRWRSDAIRTGRQIERIVVAMKQDGMVSG